MAGRTEAFGLERGILRSFKQALGFMGIYAATLGLGAAVALIPHMPLVRLVVASQFVDGLQLPIILGIMSLALFVRTMLGLG